MRTKCMTISDYFSDCNYCGSLAELVKVVRNGKEIYYNRIMFLLDNKEMAELVLADEPEFVVGIGFVAYVQ